MKKIFAVIISLAMIIISSSCGNSIEDKMIIAPTSFSSETKEALKIFGNDLGYWDYTVDDSIKSVSIDMWNFIDGRWENSGCVSGDIIDRFKSRIAINVSEGSYEIFNIDDTGYTQSAYKPKTAFEESFMAAQGSLAEKAEIVPGKEIVLWCKIGSDKNEMRNWDIQSFRDVYCTAGVALTITFNDYTID